MKKTVTDVLNKPAIRKIAFSFGSIYINASRFASVATAIGNDKITVRYKSSLGSKNGSYVYTANKLLLGFKKTKGDGDREALIVHECVHAAFDITGTAIIVKHSEAAAYIAQCVYFYYQNEGLFTSGGSISFSNPILKAAWKVAMITKKRSRIKNSEMAPLYLAISKHSLYKKSYNKTDNYDGV